MPEDEEPGMGGLGAFGGASTIVPDFHVAPAHGPVSRDTNHVTEEGGEGREGGRVEGGERR